MKKIAVIGCGASGMMAAIAAARNGAAVTIFDKNDKAGKKLFITGKGRCNLTNASSNDNIINHIVTNPRFMYGILNNLSSQDTMAIFEDAGCKLKIERGDRVFPESDHSSDVITALLNMMKKENVNIRLNSPISDISIHDNVCDGIIKNNKYEKYDSVIISTGGMSYPITGSTGDGYRWASRAGHIINNTRPALVPIDLYEDISHLAGLSLRNVGISVYVDDKKIYDDFGEMLYTHTGLSGPIILSMSSYITDIDFASKDVIAYIDLKPALSIDKLDNRVIRDLSQYQNKDMINALKDLMPLSLIPHILDKAQIDAHMKVHDLTKPMRLALVNCIKKIPYHIRGLRGWNEAIITQGGIDVKQINPKTMQSKIINNLYFTGEIIDVDALTGGYNLQIAWSTGYVAGVSAATCN